MFASLKTGRVTFGAHAAMSSRTAAHSAHHVAARVRPVRVTAS
jgi:hypothetical protein